MVFAWPGLIVLGTSAVLAGVIGVFLVYLQHNFEDTYWDRKPDHDFHKATLEGSSSLDFRFKLWFEVASKMATFPPVRGASRVAA